MPTCWAMVRKTSPWLRGLDEAPTFTGFVRSSFEAGRAAAFFPTFVAILATPLAWRCSLQPIGCEHEKRKRDSRPGSAYRGRRSCATGAAAEALLRGRPRESAGQYQLRGRGVTLTPMGASRSLSARRRCRGIGLDLPDHELPLAEAHDVQVRERLLPLRVLVGVLAWEPHEHRPRGEIFQLGERLNHREHSLIPDGVPAQGVDRIRPLGVCREGEGGEAAATGHRRRTTRGSGTAGTSRVHPARTHRRFPVLG